ncbi:hypothetical protein V8E52_009461 [Russula decolorans]
MRHRIPHLLLSLAFAWSLLVGLAAAAPAPLNSSTETLYRRQENGSSITQPVVTQTVQTINTPSGPVTETCIVTLTPVTGNNGEHLVQVVRQCTVVPGAQSSDTQTEPPSTSTAASTSSSSDAPPSSTSSPPPASTSPVDPGVSVVGVSSVPNPAATNAPSSTTPPSTSTKSSKSSSSNGLSAAADNTASASSSAAAAFQIPGKKISVLPIGLGIFAGISVIALIVVGLVTYERTKYRKIFRQRKLAEQGSSMGYS